MRSRLFFRCFSLGDLTFLVTIWLRLLPVHFLHQNCRHTQLATSWGTKESILPIWRTYWWLMRSIFFSYFVFSFFFFLAWTLCYTACCVAGVALEPPVRFIGFVAKVCAVRFQNIPVLIFAACLLHYVQPDDCVLWCMWLAGGWMAGMSRVACRVFSAPHARCQRRGAM